MEEIKEALSSISVDIKDIKAQLNILVQTQPVNTPVKWLDSQDVIMMLHISKRKLQYLRNKNTIPYSRINNKFYYKASDIDEFLKEKYNGVTNQ
jgi:hypothetical protein